MSIKKSNGNKNQAFCIFFFLNFLFSLFSQVHNNEFNNDTVLCFSYFVLSVLLLLLSFAEVDRRIATYFYNRPSSSVRTQTDFRSLLFFFLGGGGRHETTTGNPSAFAG